MTLHWEEVAEGTWALMRGDGALELALLPYEGRAVIHEVVSLDPHNPHHEFLISGALFTPPQVYPTFESAQGAAEVAARTLGDLVA